LAIRAGYRIILLLAFYLFTFLLPDSNKSVRVCNKGFSDLTKSKLPILTPLLRRLIPSGDLSNTRRAFILPGLRAARITMAVLYT